MMAHRTRFLRKRTLIPAPLRLTNANALRHAGKRLDASRQHIYLDFKHQAALWEHSDTTFGAFDVEAADPAIAAQDAVPLRWQLLRPVTIVPTVSALGAAAGRE